MKLGDDVQVQLPLKYLWGGMGMAVSVIAFVFYVGTQISGIENKFDSRILASERQIEDINKELEFRIQIRTQLMNKLDSIEHRLSLIEGGIEVLRHDRSR